MRQRGITIAGMLVLLLVTLSASLAAAEEPPVVKGADQREGNRCVECHVRPVAADLGVWQGDILAQAENPCITLRRAREELFYTESLVEAVEGAASRPAALDEALARRRQAYIALLSSDLQGLEAFAGAAGQVRLQWSEVYARVHDAADTRTLLLIYGIALAVTAVLIWGLIQAWRITEARGGAARLRAGTATGVALAALVAFAVFLWPFRAGEDPNSVMAQGDTVRQATVDKAEASAEAAERTMAKGWMLSQIAADWARVDPAAAEAAFRDAQEAMQALAQARSDYLADMRAVATGALNWQQQDDALVAYLQNRIRDAAHRTWGWRAAAEAWSRVDRGTADALLRQAVRESLKEPSAYYRDLDLAGIAVVWGQWDADQAEATADLIYDPFLQARTWTHLGSEWATTERGQAAFARALEAAGRIDDGYRRFLALMGLAEAWQPTSDAMHRVALGAAREAASDIASSLTAAYALARWSAAWAPLDLDMAVNTVLSIDPVLPEPRTLGLRDVAAAVKESDSGRAEALLQQAWEEASHIARLFDRARAQASLLAVWAEVNPSAAEAHLGEIGRPEPRALAQRDVAVAWAQADASRALEVAAGLDNPAAAVQAYVRIAESLLQKGDEAGARRALEAASEQAGAVETASPLGDLALAWARVDLDRALETADRISDRVVRAEVLRELSVRAAAQDLSRGRTLFARALEEARSAWVLGEPFAAAEVLRTLGAAWADLDPALAGEAFRQAHEAALAVPGR
ncbi:MAG: hypothetical protein ACP5UM_03695 [Anaerolineae bacterium]